MINYTCHFCGKPAPKYHNFCSWQCQIDKARAAGGKTIAPNNLPIVCVTADNTLMEHEHANHPTYLFPVEVQYMGSDFDEEFLQAAYGRPLTEDEKLRSRDQSHALIYTDGSIAITLYEYSYAMWLVFDGACFGGNLWDNRKEWRLAQASIDEIKERLGAK